MVRAREAILAYGGAGSNVFTRIQLALFGAVPWRAVPVMPVEIMLLPRWFPFHLDKVSYWSRTVIVPLLVLMAKKPRARNPRASRIDELFVEPPRQCGDWPNGAASECVGVRRSSRRRRVLRFFEPFFPKRRASGDRERGGVGDERLNGEDGLGAIYPGDGQQRDDV